MMVTTRRVHQLNQRQTRSKVSVRGRRQKKKFDFKLHDEKLTSLKARRKKRQSNTAEVVDECTAEIVDECEENGRRRPIRKATKAALESIG